jgi:transcriptional regulator with XRE-family HTH domain
MALAMALVLDMAMAMALVLDMAMAMDMAMDMAPATASAQAPARATASATATATAMATATATATANTTGERNDQQNIRRSGRLPMIHATLKLTHQAIGRTQAMIDRIGGMDSLECRSYTSRHKHDAKHEERRKELGLTLEQLAALTESTKSYVWEIENKPNIRPSALKVYRLAEALELPWEFLVMGRMPTDARETEALAAFRKIETTELKDAAVAMMRGLTTPPPPQHSDEP